MVHTIDITFPELQWGHNFIVAEISAARSRSVTVPPVLQWGRNFIVAEI